MGVGQCRVRRVYAACAGGGVSKVFGFIETFSGKRNRDFAVAVGGGYFGCAGSGIGGGAGGGSFKTAMALLKPVITVLLAMPPIIGW